MSDPTTPSNEGEGSRSAARRYEEGLKEHLERGDVDAEAERARREVEASPEEHRDAEAEGKARSAGEAPGDLGE